MNLIDYGRILIRRGWIIILLAVIAAGSAYFLSQRQTPIYRSTQLVLIQPSRNDLGLAEATIRLLNSYVVYLDSEQIAQQVIDNLQLDMTPGQLKSGVTIAADQLRLVIQIDADLPDGELANRVARAWGETLVQYREQQNQISRREDRIDAVLPDYPRYSRLRPNPTVNAAAGGVLGVMLGAIIVFVLEYLESSVVRRREDIERALDLPVLAAVPDME
jgi:capsular polysaccharide biosynthesis protein